MKWIKSWKLVKSWELMKSWECMASRKLPDLVFEKVPMISSIPSRRMVRAAMPHNTITENGASACIICHGFAATARLQAQPPAPLVYFLLRQGVNIELLRRENQGTSFAQEVRRQRKELAAVVERNLERKKEKDSGAATQDSQQEMEKNKVKPSFR